MSIYVLEIGKIVKLLCQGQIQINFPLYTCYLPNPTSYSIRIYKPITILYTNGIQLFHR